MRWSSAIIGRYDNHGSGDTYPCSTIRPWARSTISSGPPFPPSPGKGDRLRGRRHRSLHRWLIVPLPLGWKATVEAGFGSTRYISTGGEKQENYNGPPLSLMAVRARISTRSAIGMPFNERPQLQPINSRSFGTAAFFPIDIATSPSGSLGRRSGRRQERRHSRSSPNADQEDAHAYTQETGTRYRRDTGNLLHIGAATLHQGILILCRTAGAPIRRPGASTNPERARSTACATPRSARHQVLAGCRYGRADPR